MTDSYQVQGVPKKCPMCKLEYLKKYLIHMKNKDIFRDILFLLNHDQLKKLLLSEQEGHKKSYLFDKSTGSFEYLPHFTVSLCVKLIRKFIHKCKMQRGKELFRKEGFQYICMFKGVIGR